MKLIFKVFLVITICLVSLCAEVFVKDKEANELNEKALQYSTDGEYRQAIKFGQNALDKAILIHGENNEFVALLVHNLAAYYSNVDEYDLALEFDKRGLAIREKIFSPNDPNIADSLIRLSIELNRANAYSEAEINLNRALRIYKNNKHTDASDYRELWQEFGKLYTDLGHYEKGKKAYRTALEYGRKVPEEENKLASIYDHMGNIGIYSDQVDDKTLEFYRLALKIKQKYLGNEHYEVGTSYNNIGAYYYVMGDLDLSEKNYLQALKIREKTSGEQSSDVAQTLNNMGELYRQKGEYKKSIDYLKRAIEIDSNVYGADNTEVATGLNNLALTYYDMDEYQEAKKYVLQALKIREEKLPPNHADIEDSRSLLESIDEEMQENNSSE